MRISFVGSGNIAHHLANAAYANKVEVVQIVSRNIENAKALAEKVNANYSDSISDLNPEVDFVILAVNDDSLDELSLNLKTFKAPLVHTAGSVNISILNNTDHNYGVLYPLQTFSKSKNVDIQKVPFFIEANSESLIHKLQEFCSIIGAHSINADSTQRLNLHIAAVFACNFSNNMYHIAQNLVESHQLSFDVLKPLIMETAQKINSLDPKDAQTGPAKRKDVKTIQKHLEALQSNEALYSLYKAISENIQKNQDS